MVSFGLILSLLHHYLQSGEVQEFKAAAAETQIDVLGEFCPAQEKNNLSSRERNFFNKDACRNQAIISAKSKWLP